MSMSLTRRIRRLVQRVHSIFDRSPEARLAFRVRALTGTLTWEVARGRLQIRRNGALALDLALEGATIGEIAAAVAGLAGVRVETTRTRGYYETQPVPVESVTLLDADTVERVGLPPRWIFTRPSPAYYFDAHGNLQSAPAGRVRVHWTDGIAGILTEPASRNINPNPRFVGAVLGELGKGGALPTGMATSGGRGLQVEVQNAWTDAQGIDWLELRFFGLPVDPQIDVYFGTEFAAAVAGQDWTGSLYAHVSRGSTDGLTFWQGLGLVGAGQVGALHTSLALTRKATRWARTTTATGDATGIRHYFSIKTTPGQAADCSVSLALPQMEPIDLASTPMLPEPGKTGFSSRAAEELYILAADLPGWADAREFTLAADFLHPNHPANEVHAKAVVGLSGRTEGEVLLGALGDRATVQLAQSTVLGPTVPATGPHGFGARGIVAATMRGGTLLASFNGRQPVSPQPPAQPTYLLRHDGEPYLNHLGQPYLVMAAPDSNYVPPGAIPQPTIPALYAGYAGAAITRLALLSRSLSDTELTALARNWTWPTAPGEVYVPPVADPEEAVEQERIQDRPATLLIDGKGMAEVVGQDDLTTPTAVLWAFLAAYAKELNIAADNIARAPDAMATVTSEGEWLDELGAIYGYRRQVGEADRAYGDRIIREVLRPRGNNVAIEMAIEEATGSPATVTNVVLYGEAVPNYGGTYRRNGSQRRNATAKPIYGLFDVEAAFDLLGSETPTAYRNTVRELVERMRDAGTFLRAISLTGGNINDDGLAGQDLAGAIPLTATASLNDNGATATAADPIWAATATISDTGAVADDLEDELVQIWNVRHNGVRRRNGSFPRSGGIELTGSLAS